MPRSYKTPILPVIVAITTTRQTSPSMDSAHFVAARKVVVVAEEAVAARVAAAGSRSPQVRAVK